MRNPKVVLIMKGDLVILIEQSVEELQIMESVIHELNPRLNCISFVYSDEAIQAIEELKRKPSFIFIDANMSRLSGPVCLAILRQNSELNKCKICMFSVAMPYAVQNNLRSMGASLTFKKPTSRHEYKEVFSEILV